MRRPSTAGLTLVELLIASTVIAIIGGAAASLLYGALRAEAHGAATAQLHADAVLAMERMTNGIRLTSIVVTPNAGTPVSDTLTISALVNEDDDYYFGDPLFPRIDEDVTGDANGDDESGVMGIDDDADGSVDNGLSANDDDEDGVSEEDPINPLAYEYDASSKTLTESFPESAVTTTLSSQVTGFEALFESPERIRLTLTLTGSDGESVTIVEYAFPRNVLQRAGRRIK
jgi:type II secretory pathway pseudopilin PulG